MNKSDLICPVCEEGHLHEATFADDFKHGDSTIHVEGLECFVCKSCGADPVFKDQIRRNHLRVADAKRSVDGLLIGEQIKAIRAEHGLSQSDAAELFGGGANAFSKYERGDVIQSKSMDKLLRLASKYPLIVLELGELAGIQTAIDEEYTNRYTKKKEIILEQNVVARKNVTKARVIKMESWSKSAA
jgi:HTH-type transcriptional regulator/antitoxin MqsA